MDGQYLSYQLVGWRMAAGFVGRESEVWLPITHTPQPGRLATARLILPAALQSASICRDLQESAESAAITQADNKVQREHKETFLSGYGTLN